MKSELNKKPKVSIIIPVYNVEDYLKECIDSVIAQSLRDIEIICIDDGSTDKSFSILEDYSKKDNRIITLSKLNEGQGPTRNLGIEIANGEYIVFVDSDDYIKEDMIEKLYNRAKKYDLDMVMCQVARFDDETKEPLPDSWYYNLKYFDNWDKEVFNHKDTKDFTFKLSVTPVNKIYKRSFLLKNDIKFPKGLIFEDEFFFIKSYLLSSNVSFIKEQLYFYRFNRENSTMELRSKRNIDILSIFNLIYKFLKEVNLLGFYQMEFYNRFIHLILRRFFESSTSYQKIFYIKIKENFKDLSEDIIENLDISIKPTFENIINSNNFNEFKRLNKHKLFSVVIAMYNTEEYIKEAIESIIDQNLGFLNIEIIIVDDGSTDSSGEIALEYAEKYPYNIKYIYQENQGQSVARNNGMKFANGNFLNFLDSDDKISRISFRNAYNLFEKNKNLDVVSIPMVFFDREYGNHILNYKYNKTMVVNLFKNPEFPQFAVNSTFIRKEAIKGFYFDKNLITSEDAVLVNKILIRNPKLGLLKEAAYYYRKRLDMSSTLDNSYLEKEYFTDRLIYFFKELIEESIDYWGHVLEFIQYTLAYDLNWMAKIRDIENVFSKEEEKEFWKIFRDVLTYIDDEIIKNHKVIDQATEYFLLAIKKGGRKVQFDNYGRILLKIDDDILMDNLNIHKIWLDIVEIKKGFLNISGFLMSYFNPNNVFIIAIKEDSDGNKEKFEAKYFEYPSRKGFKFLSVEWNSFNCFDLKIPLSKDFNSKVSLFVNYIDSSNNRLIELTIDFQNHCNISSFSNYFIKDSKIVLFKNNSFYIMPYSYRSHLNFEFSCLKKIFNDKGPYYTSALAFRMVYFLLYPFIKNKKIWLFMDRQDGADDNAEHLFKYAVKQKDNVKKYFTVSKDSKDFLRLKGLKNLLPFYSIKQRLIYLFAEKIISSHPDDKVLNPFFAKNIRLYNGLFTAKKYYLQHGVVQDNLSHWLRKFNNNLSLITTTSQLEYDSHFDEGYNFDESVIQLLGLARFDNLTNEVTKKQILIMPTWRQNLQFNKENLINSNYFINLNKLLNNEKFIDVAINKGYKIIFRPHPNLYEFIDLFDINNNIVVSRDETYQELFNESALLITDYSSVAFDFSYLKKPLIYYQYDDKFNFDMGEGYFNYETMGFGEVIEDEEDLIDLVSNYLDNNCQMKDKFIDRVNKFFKFKDKNNCKRIYDFILND